MRTAQAIFGPVAGNEIEAICNEAGARGTTHNELVDAMCAELGNLQDPNDWAAYVEALSALPNGDLMVRRAAHPI